MRRLLVVLGIVLGLGAPASAQPCNSTQGQQAYCTALTNNLKFGLPRIATASLPACVTNNKGAIAYDTTANLVKYCTGSAWTTVGAGGGVSGLTIGVIPMAASATSLADSLLSQSGGNVTLASGQLLLPAGTAAAPSIALGGEQTGFHLSSAGVLGISLAGSLRYTMGASAFSAGTTGARSVGTAGVRWSAAYLGGGTLTASAPAVDIATTFNNSGVTFTAFLLNATDTASAAGSLLMDLQVGSVPKFSVAKSGAVTAAAGLTATAGNVTTPAAGYFAVLGRSLWGSPADLEWNATNNAATANAGIRSSRIIEVVTTTKSPSALENGEIYTNTGDGDGSAITLLNDPTIGSQYCVAVDAAQTVTVAPSAGESILQAGTAYTTSCTNNARGSMACFVAITGGSGALWSFLSTGTWTCS